jgi:ankyrin repeat protein
MQSASDENAYPINEQVLKGIYGDNADPLDMMAHAKSMIQAEEAAKSEAAKKKKEAALALAQAQIEADEQLAKELERFEAESREAELRAAKAVVDADKELAAKIDGMERRALRANVFDSSTFLDIEFLKHLAACGKNFNERDAKGCSVVHHIAGSDTPIASVSLGVVLGAGGRVDSVDSEGKTALHYACMTGTPAVIGLLMKVHPQLLHIQDARGETALHCAYCNGSRRAVDILIAFGADESVTNAQGKRPQELQSIFSKALNLLR